MNESDFYAADWLGVDWSDWGSPNPEGSHSGWGALMGLSAIAYGAVVTITVVVTVSES